jgi:hypothetical protein
VAELTWPDGVRLRLACPAAPAAPADGAAAPAVGPVLPAETARTRLHFARAGTQFSTAELDRAAVLAGRLGTVLHLGGSRRRSADKS